MADKKKAPGKKVVNLDVGASKFEFHVGIVEFNRLQNEMMPHDKTTPSENFIVDTVQGGDEKKHELMEFIDGGYALDIAQLVSAGFKPDLKIAVKK